MADPMDLSDAVRRIRRTSAAGIPTSAGDAAMLLAEYDRRGARIAELERQVGELMAVLAPSDDELDEARAALSLGTWRPSLDDAVARVRMVDAARRVTEEWDHWCPSAPTPLHTALDDLGVAVREMRSDG